MFDALTTRTAAVDSLTIDTYRRTLGAAHPGGVALLAVGGYGRLELFPHSDVDLLVLTASPFADREPLSLFLRDLWDAGLRVSQSVRTVEECTKLHEGNTELTISLLDQRLLTGDALLHARLTTAWEPFLRQRRRPVRERLCALTRQRHARFQDSLYHLEPDVKDGPGGLRDRNACRWLALLDAPWQPPALDEAGAFLMRVRHGLHEATGRDDNRLSFELQDRLAGSLAGGDPATLMRDYYRHARGVHQALERTVAAAEERQGGLITSLRDRQSRLSNAEFTVSRNRVFLRVPHQWDAEPEALLRLFAFVARHGIPPAPETEDRVTERVRQGALPAAMWAPMEELFNQPHAALALRAMHRTGTLAALMPEWAHLDCLVVRDYHHRFTVDEHTLVAVDTVDDLATTDQAEARRFRDLLAEVDEPGVLRLALLLHDIGKGTGAEDHAVASERMAREVLNRWGAPELTRATVELLVEKHLALSSVMTSRDLDDPATAKAIAEAAGTVERLRLLTLLTYADISAVTPGALTPWRREQLWRAYLAGVDALTRGLEMDRIRETEAVPAFSVGFPDRYRRTHTAADMAVHQDLAQQASENEVALDLRRERGAWLLTVVAPDRPGLLADLAGALSAFGLEITKAEAFGNRQGMILDRFAVDDPMRTLDLNPPERDRLQRLVADAARGTVDVGKLLAARRGPKRRLHGAPTVHFVNDPDVAATLVEVVAADRPGLLYDLTRTLSANGCDIDVVLVDTEAGRALDVFYVTAGGGRLDEPRQNAVAEALRACC